MRGKINEIKKEQNGERATMTIEYRKLSENKMILFDE